MVMMNLAMAFERTDEVILPAVYAFVAASFNATLTQVRFFTFSFHPSLFFSSQKPSSLIPSAPSPPLSPPPIRSRT
jgi:hypothetical protein